MAFKRSKSTLPLSSSSYRKIITKYQMTSCCCQTNPQKWNSLNKHETSKMKFFNPKGGRVFCILDRHNVMPVSWSYVFIWSDFVKVIYLLFLSFLFLWGIWAFRLWFQLQIRFWFWIRFWIWFRIQFWIWFRIRFWIQFRIRVLLPLQTILFH